MRLPSFLATTVSIVVLPLLINPKQADAADKMIYWNNGATISRANLDGTGKQQLAGTSYGSCGIAIDSIAGKMYWSDFDIPTVRRSNLDGSHVENIFTGSECPIDIALDVSAGRMYFSDLGSIKWTNFDGSNAHTIYNSDDYVMCIALDSLSGKIYWANYEAGKIQRSNLDGSNVQEVITASSNQGIDDIALDTANGKIYWTEEFTGYIACANLDGSNVQHLQVGGAGFFGITLDTDAGKMYWGCVDSSSYVSIKRSNLDGSDTETVVSTDGYPAMSIAIGPVPEPASALLIGAGILLARLRRRHS
jgi:hypothetical protein